MLKLSHLFRRVKNALSIIKHLLYIIVDNVNNVDN
nr:MAG TPA: hypothetical protein [Caudoviricetes sp.]